MTIDSWRPGRDHEGWRRVHSLWQQIEKDDEDWSGTEVEDDDVPTLVKAIPRFKDNNVRALQKLMEADKLGANDLPKFFYGFGDVSGSGFGATIQIGDEIHYEYDQWCSEVMETKTSNCPARTQQPC
jgi:hypothetical protein